MISNKVKSLWRYAIVSELKTKEIIEITKQIINSLQILIYMPEPLQKLYWKYLNDQ